MGDSPVQLSCTDVQFEQLVSLSGGDQDIARKICSQIDVTEVGVSNALLTWTVTQVRGSLHLYRRTPVQLHYRLGNMQTYATSTDTQSDPAMHKFTMHFTLFANHVPILLLAA